LLRARLNRNRGILIRWSKKDASDVEEAALDRAAAIAVEQLGAHGLRARIVSKRLNRRKIDLIPTAKWADPPKARIDELLVAVEKRLRKHGLDGLRAAVEVGEQAAAEPGLAGACVTSDAKHVEIGLTDKSARARGRRTRRTHPTRPARRRERAAAVARGLWVLEPQDHGQVADRGWTYSIGVRQQPHIKAAIAAIPEQDWQTLEDYPEGGEAQIAQTMLGRQRLVIRRTRLIGAQAELWPDWRHFAFLTNRTDTLELVESEHRQHAVVELAIRDLKDQALAHFPSGKFLANAAWTVMAALAHNLLRWTTVIGLPDTVIPHRPDVAPPATDRSRPDHPHRAHRDTPDATPGGLGLSHFSALLSVCARYQHSLDRARALTSNDRARTPASACPNRHDRAAVTTSTGPATPANPARSPRPCRERTTRARPATNPSTTNTPPSNGGFRLSRRCDPLRSVVPPNSWPTATDVRRPTRR
jgi:hypothetical protein